MHLVAIVVLPKVLKFSFEVLSVSERGVIEEFETNELTPISRSTNGRDKGIVPQYSSTRMTVSTRTVTIESAGSGEWNSRFRS